jgi:hypothetical protein
VDDILDNYTEDQLSEVVFEVVNDRGHALLWVRLPDRTLVFDLASTKAAEKPVWYIMTSSASDTFAPYRGVDVIWCYDNWQVGVAVSANIGILDDSVSTHFGDEVYLEFSTAIVYGEGSGAVFHSVELVALPGRVAFEEDAYVTTSYSVDGQNWSQQRPLFIGERGHRTKRLIWRRQGNMRNFRIQKFTGDSKAYLAVARLEAQIEGLIA